MRLPLVPFFAMIVTSSLLYADIIVRCNDGYCYEKTESAFHQLFNHEGYLWYYRDPQTSVNTKQTHCPFGQVGNQIYKILGTQECYGHSPTAARYAPEHAYKKDTRTDRYANAYNTAKVIPSQQVPAYDVVEAIPDQHTPQYNVAPATLNQQVPAYNIVEAIPHLDAPIYNAPQVTPHQQIPAHNVAAANPHRLQRKDPIPIETKPRRVPTAKPAPFTPVEPFNRSCMSHYKYGSTLGKGSFGTVILGYAIANNSEVAIKMEHMDEKQALLEHEFRMYKEMNANGTIKGIPVAYCYGPAYGTYANYRGMAMQRLGKSIEDLDGFSEKTVLMLAAQMINRVESVHKAGYLYQDIKPDNFVMGYESLDERNTVYLIDFGLAERYVDNQGKHLSPRRMNTATGTMRYAAEWTHQLKSQSRRNDMEALGFMFAYLLLGQLPWQGLRNEYNPRETLRRFHPMFARYFENVRKLGFYDKPDYKALVDGFERAIRERYTYDYVFEWTVPEDIKRNRQMYSNIR